MQSSASKDSPYRKAPLFDDFDGGATDSFPKVTKIVSSRPISNSVAFGKFVDFLGREKDKAFSTGRRRRLETLSVVAESLPLENEDLGKLQRILMRDHATPVPTQSVESDRFLKSNTIPSTTPANPSVGENLESRASTLSKKERKEAKSREKQARKEAKRLKKEAKKAKKEAKKVKKEAKKVKKEPKHALDNS